MGKYVLGTQNIKCVSILVLVVGPMRWLVFTALQEPSEQEQAQEQAQEQEMTTQDMQYK